VRKAALMLALAALTALTACSDEAPTQAAAPPAPAEPGDCVETFVQRYEESAADAAPVDAQNICFEGSTAEGPPRYPTRSLTIRLEYDRGDHFVVQESADWAFGEEPDVARGCVVARLERTTVVERVVGGVKESAMTRRGETLRSAATGEQYGSRIRLGSGPGELPNMIVPQNPATELLREESPYGTCLRAHTVPMKSSSCTLEQPRECKSGQVMLPIEMRFPNAQGGTQVGRTTSLERVAANQSEWVVP
jgi:hypothetical protein